VLAVLPMVVQDDFWLSVLIYVGITAVGALGLNLLTGYCGQISLGHAFFIGAGAYITGWLGGKLGLPLVLWLPLAAVTGGLLGAVVGPFALRLRGHYLAIVTLGLVFIGEHLWRNLKGLTGGNSGTSVNAGISVGPVDFNRLVLAGEVYSRNQGFFWLVWALVAVVALLVKNLVRTRPGRALQAVRDRDQAAEVIGVRAGRYKIGAFVVSSAIASVAGALFGRTSSSSARTSGTCCCPSSTSRSSSSAGWDGVRVRPRRDLRWRAARVDRPVRRRHPRRADQRRRRGLHQRVRPQPGHFRRAHRPVPGVRAAWARRDLAADQGVLQVLAVLVLIARRHIHARHHPGHRRHTSRRRMRRRG